MRSKSNTLYLVTGLPASGKTHFARLLAVRLRAALVDIDASTEPLIQAALRALKSNPDDRDSPFFKKSFRDPIYDTLFSIASANIGHIDVIISGPFTSEMNNPAWLSEIHERLELPCNIRAFYLRCDPDTLKKRIIQRANPRDTGKLTQWDVFLKYYQTSNTPAFPHTVIDTTDLNLESLSTLIDQID